MLADSLIAPDGVGDLLQAGTRLGRALLRAERRLPQRRRDHVEDRATPLLAPTAPASIH